MQLQDLSSNSRFHAQIWKFWKLARISKTAARRAKISLILTSSGRNRVLCNFRTCPQIPDSCPNMEILKINSYHGNSCLESKTKAQSQPAWLERIYATLRITSMLSSVLYTKFWECRSWICLQVLFSIFFLKKQHRIDVSHAQYCICELPLLSSANAFTRATLPQEATCKPYNSPFHNIAHWENLTEVPNGNKNTNSY